MHRLSVAVLLGLAACSDRDPSDVTATSTDASLSALLSGDEQAGFAVADTPRTFRFPEDHGPHPAFRNEWWYFTGNLRDADGRRFGYELTLFRVSLTPPPVNGAARSAWATRQVFFGHFAVSDIAEQRFYAAERLSRGHSELAFASAEPFRVTVGDWTMQEAGQAGTAVWRLTAGDTDHAIDLTVRTDLAPVLQGEGGRSQKSADPHNASYYYSIPRWASAGSVRVGGQTYTVSGESWLDREWSTSALAPDQVGWDWFALQLDDAGELMYYQLRRADGSADPYSGGSLRTADGHVQHLREQDVRIAVTGEWANELGDRYPAGWTLDIASLGLELDVLPAMADQELDTVVRYWEGAVDVTGTRDGQPLAGHGYVELTGYSGTAGSRGQAR